MNIKKVLKEQLSLIMPNEKEISHLKQETDKLLSLLKEEIIRQKIGAEPFVGGSFVKETLIKTSGFTSSLSTNPDGFKTKGFDSAQESNSQDSRHAQEPKNNEKVLDKNKYDIDIFIRFDWRFDNISALLEKIVQQIAKKASLKINKLHGSRDYFQLQHDKGVIFELIPTYKIKKPKEARNVTDLSYFHVNYVKKKFSGNSLKKEVLLAKQFAQAQNIYGAESHIQGFSGYSLECLIIYYKSFIKMLKELSTAEKRIVLDPEKHYKNETDALFSLNESKLQSPVILVDPTFKERNVLAALSRETFKKFQKSAKAFLISPSSEFFQIHSINTEKLKQLADSKKAEFLHLHLSTDKQEGDIAGTKMKKFSRFLEKELYRYFDIFQSEFVYNNKQGSEFYLALKPKNKITIFGPPTSMSSDAIAFKKRHKNAFEKSGKLFSELIIDFSASDFIKKFKVKNAQKLKEMGITDLKII